MIGNLIRFGGGGGMLTAVALAGFSNYGENSSAVRSVKHSEMGKWRIEGPIKDPADGTLIAKRVG